MKQLILFLVYLVSGLTALSSDTFTVMVYNVENLFDLDGVAIFQEYEQSPAGEYGSEELLNKLAGIHRSLAALNEGEGPEVVMFQELELDRTPFDGPDAAAFLESTRDCTLEALLNGDCKVGFSVANLPSELLLLKFLEDRGMTGYHIAQPDPFKSETHPPHKNVVFSRFPIRFIRQRPCLNARDLLVVGLDVEGHELIVMNNHWKSGASSPGLEPVRAQNARVVRAELDAILYQNPNADVIIAGDLNCYYNQKAVFSEITEAAVNDVMNTHGMERRMLDDGINAGLYNLWYELPEKERGSEVWRGYWGTLMQILLVPGLYDDEGIQYVDNSFNRLIMPGINVDERWGRPISWNNFGGGSGFSDHLPVYAEFKVADGQPIQLKHPAKGILSAYRPQVDMRNFARGEVSDLMSLAGLDDRTFASQLGKLFLLKGPLAEGDPPRVQVGKRLLQVYSPVSGIRKQLDAVQPGDEVHAYVELSTYRGQLQVVIQDASWFIKTSR